MMENNILQLLRNYYANYGDKHLHIMTEDANIDKSNIEFCLNECIKHQNREGIIICNEFLKLKKSVRKFIVNELYNEYRYE